MTGERFTKNWTR